MKVLAAFMELVTLYVILVNQQLTNIQSLYAMQWKTDKHCLVVKTIVSMLRKKKRTVLIWGALAAKCKSGFKHDLTAELLVSLSF